ncbi:hypothetical protein EDB19DRAFT_601910 [Suillus lakei]|nr:hypothetical protein EDB19DRAFT_601910 [Suillus lakei]
MPSRDNGSGDSDDDGDDDDDDESSTAIAHHTTSTSTSTNQSSSSSSSSSSTTFTTHSSSSSFLGSGSFSGSSSSSSSIPSSTITTHSSSSYIIQSSSVSQTANTDTSTSSSSAYASTTISTSSSSSGKNNVYGLTSTASHGLSTGARASLACGIMFSLILSALVVCYFRRRSSRSWDQIIDEPPISSSEVSQYWPPDSVASREREVLPPPQSPPRLDTVHPYSPDISHSPPLPPISSAASLTNDDSCIEIYALYLRGATVVDNRSSANNYARCAYSPKFLPTHSRHPPVLRRMRPQPLHEHIQFPMELGSPQVLQ